MRSKAGRAMWAAAVLTCAPACRHASPMSPQQIDQISAHCRQRLAPGTVDVRDIRSSNIGHRAENAPAGTPVLLYGASWCQACDVAASYMTRRGIPFVERGVEEEPPAQ